MTGSAVHSATRKAGAPPRIQGCALDLGSAKVPLYSGAMHYFRIKKQYWRKSLEAVRDLGLRIVETYIPWGVHEIDGRVDFGESNEDLDLGAFLDLVHELGMYAIVRPGPHINAELTYFGLPERIVYDPACQARSPRQNPVIQPFPPRMFPVPSYASNRYHEETGRWFDAVAEVVRPRLWPAGPVVLVQVDNEAAYFFRNGPYDQDYHPDAIALFREYLENRYGDIAALNAAHRTRYESWEAVDPPLRFDAKDEAALVPHLDWAAFQEYLVTHALDRMQRRLRDAGITRVPTLHNIPLGESGLPLSIPAIDEVVDLVGLDYYHPAREHRTVKRRTALLAGTCAFPYSPELGVGAPPWFTPLSHHDSLTVAMTAAAYGLRGWNLYMAVDRDRWYGAPIDARGNARPTAATWRRWHDAAEEVQFHRLARAAEVAIVIPEEYRRLSRATHLLGGIASPSAVEAVGGTPVDGCSEATLGFKGPVQILWWRWVARVSDALTRLGVPYVWIDAGVDDDVLAAYRLLFSPTFEFASEARMAALASAQDAGVQVVVGPALPALDETLLPHAFAFANGTERVHLDTDADADALCARWVAELQIETPYHVTPAPVETAAHTDHGVLRMLFVINPSKDVINATVTLPSAATFEDVITGERLEGHDTLAVHLLPQSCRALMVLGEHRKPDADDDKRVAARPTARARVGGKGTR